MFSNGTFEKKIEVKMNNKEVFENEGKISRINLIAPFPMEYL